jgi:tetratricopeptide (TPR) repeat protein
MIKLAAALICKDDTELPQMRKAIATIINSVDALYITATGDKTTEIEEYCRVNRKLGFDIHYSYFKWVDDFSKARNFNFAQVPEGFDYIWWMDTDDLLAGGERLKEVAQMAKDNGKDVVFFTYWYGCAFNGEPAINSVKEVLMEQNRERLIRPGTHIWKGRLHETPVPVEGAKNNYTKYQYDPKDRPMVVVHTAEDKGLEEKMMRNKRLLELQLDDERRKGEADPRTLLYLMKIYAEAGTKAEMEKCMVMGQEYLAKSGWDEERAVCWEQMGISCGKLGDTKKAVDCFQNAVKEWPHQPLLYIRLATAYFNLGQYNFAEHWMKIGASIDIDNGGSNLTNMKAMKTMYAELLLKLNWNAHRDTKKALESATLLFNELPTKANAEQVMFIENFDKLNDACGYVDKLSTYLDATDNRDAITPLLDILPDGITNQPFAQKLRQKYAKPRRWAKNEICYFANFGAAHFEKWDYSSLKSGIGGSETAVLELSKEWVKLGYKVTIYSDPIIKGEQEGVTILPWYYFNPRDSFNIIIEWRAPALAGKVKYKKLLVDMHDVFYQGDFVDKPYDKVVVKSEYHKAFGKDIKNVEVIPNGI